jgi:hypothetical protein
MNNEGLEGLTFPGDFAMDAYFTGALILNQIHGKQDRWPGDCFKEERNFICHPLATTSGTNKISALRWLLVRSDEEPTHILSHCGLRPVGKL